MITLAKLLLPASLLVWFIGFNEQLLEQSTEDKVDTTCVTTMDFRNKALSDTLKKYVAMVKEYELPIIAVQHQKDTTFYYVSALMSTDAIQRNRPTSILRQYGREMLFYDFTDFPKGITPACEKYLLKKYVKVLHIDKIIAKSKLPPTTSQNFAYDPIMIKMVVVGDRVTMVKPDSLPHFNYHH